MKTRPILIFLMLSTIHASATTWKPCDLSLDNISSSNQSLRVAAAFPGKETVFIHAPSSDWTRYQSIELTVVLETAATNTVQALFHVMDWDGFWYQKLIPGFLTPGSNKVRIPFDANDRGWKMRGHHSAWHLRTLCNPMEVGISLFSKDTGSITGHVSKASVALRKKDTSPPWIRTVRANSNSVPCFEKFELTFDIPDRYRNPFDPREVSVIAEFTSEDGTITEVPGFYGRHFYRHQDSAGRRLIPQGKPYWRIRYAASIEGTHSYRIIVRDHLGETVWGPAEFSATEARQQGFIRVSRRDPRFFEFDDGSPLFIAGHNIRSPFDTRMNKQFPWMQRWDDGASVYTDYFKKMSEYGENLAEIWTASWSLGLEWSAKWHGYHGIGQYNMMHAWELDRVIEDAEMYNIFINLVIHNHGKFSSTTDPEWKSNPFNIDLGGYLRTPEDYFSDPRAMESFRNLMRYRIARWGYSTRIFTWELWSELNLTGSKGTKIKNYRRPECVDWHRMMGFSIKDMDPYDHPISTHVSGDYKIQNPDIISLPEIDHCAVDAYHGSKDPLHIVDLMRATVRYNNPYGKPVIITEFGGSHMGSNLDHLSDTLHAAIWASTVHPIGGTPMFWWWQTIDEENLFPLFTSAVAFMEDLDRLDPTMDLLPKPDESDAATNLPTVTLTASASLGLECYGNKTHLNGWMYRSSDFQNTDPRGPAITNDAVLHLDAMTPGDYRVEFWDTTLGKRVYDKTQRIDATKTAIFVPAFTRDTAFKIRPQR